MTSRRSLLPLASVLVLGLLGSPGSLARPLAGPRPAAADVKPENVFAGKIMTSDKRFPFKAKSGSAFVAAIKKQTKTQFQENKANKTWHVYYAAFFRKPLADIEVEVKLYDALKGSAPVASFSQFLDERGGRSLLSEFTLERALLEDSVNHELAMVLEVGGVAVAKGKFKILGEVERYKGKVNFSADEDDDDE